jgi:hypothetical protein
MKLNVETNKELILSLIKDNLKNTLLISGLNKLGVEAGSYQLNLTDSIFQLIGLKEMSMKKKHSKGTQLL